MITDERSAHSLAHLLQFQTQVGSKEHTYHEWAAMQTHIRGALAKWNDKNNTRAAKLAVKAGAGSNSVAVEGGADGDAPKALVLGTSDGDIVEYLAVLMVRDVSMDVFRNDV
jgi:hypothetical protein